MGDLEAQLARLGRVVKARPKRQQPANLVGDTCEARQFSDTMSCRRCAIQYDVNDRDPPTCPRDGRTCPASGVPGRR